MSNNLTIQELALMMSIIDVGCSRGNFTGADASHVGALYNRLKGLVDEAEATAEEKAVEKLAQ